MNNKKWIAPILLVICGAVGVDIRYAKRLRQAVWNAEPQNRSTGLVLAGSIEPVVTATIQADNLQLEVPLYSMVTRGQIIGEGVVWTRERRRSLDRTALATATEGPQANAAGLDRDEAALAGAEATEREAEERLSDVTARSRQQTAGVLDEDKAVAEQRRSTAALVVARQSVDRDITGSGHADVLKRPVRRGAPEISVTGSLGPAPVAAPIDGMVVPAGSGGSVGIAADPNAICVRTVVPAYEADTVRVGRAARVKFDGTDIEVAATVKTIDSTPIESAGSSGYGMTLSLSSAPPPLGPGNTAIHIYFDRP